ncbi:trimeric intracellular cation channel family protein [Kitasatospora sp. NBC_01250]|uniref:trimeric intracellular cation channel family protein n=1 Tax=unclassified Kitasatospora TaxID=2633591 RepID=UPI002E10BD2C|nr:MULTISPECIES: trimeric intracellular cation channel family protein [unclassified Kitasatospora]WSJ69345.1 trimeric intracellular cation channel family protein [Kitasatospora sp. NBC_01302]
MTSLFSPDVQQTLDLIGIFVFALSGGLLAVRKNMDIFGICVLAEATALGGGVMRDLLIGATPPAAFTNLGYFLTPLAAGVVVFFLHPEVERINGVVQILDALGLGLFAVTGTVKAHDYGLGSVASVALGMLTAAGGGVVRDLLAMEPPSLLRWDREIYAVPALVGSTLVAVLIATGHLTTLTASSAALLAFVLRVCALRFGWRAPRAWHRNGSRTSEE